MRRKAASGPRNKVAGEIRKLEVYPRCKWSYTPVARRACFLPEGGASVMVLASVSKPCPRLAARQTPRAGTAQL